MFINASLLLNVLFDDLNRGLRQQKKQFVSFNYIVFFLKTVLDDLNL